MNKLLKSIEQSLALKVSLPFSIYSAFKEQVLLNVPIAKPLLIVVLDGEKVLCNVNSKSNINNNINSNSNDNEFTCRAGDFVFLGNSPTLNMRNIPKEKNYYALLIEFDHQDFEGLQLQELIGRKQSRQCVIGQSSELITQCLQQFVDISPSLPAALWSSRKREIIELLSHIGHADILSLLDTHQLKDKLHTLFVEPGGWSLSMTELCDKFAMSESTLRRKLHSEGTSVQEIKDLARLGLGLHLLQTTNDSISRVAEQCGYQSQSRFTDRFKKQFGLTPSGLRKTTMTD